LIISSSWPIAFVLVIGTVMAVGEFGRDWWNRDPEQFIPQRQRAALRRGIQQTLPLVLQVTFLLVPSASTLIFKTFLCDAFEYDAFQTRRYLRDDLRLDCSSDEYHNVKRAAFILAVVWPVGVPLLYSVLLWHSRKALFTGKPTTLSRATAFLWGDYQTFAFFWEPLNMCRKLALTGAQLLFF
jgi:hypothetical protein